MQNYAGGDEQEDEGETLMSFRADELIGESSGADDGEDWVATHTGSKGSCELLADCVRAAQIANQYSTVITRQE